MHEKRPPHDDADARPDSDRESSGNIPQRGERDAWIASLSRPETVWQKVFHGAMGSVLGAIVLLIILHVWNAALHYLPDYVWVPVGVLFK